MRRWQIIGSLQTDFFFSPDSDEGSRRRHVLQFLFAAFSNSGWLHNVKEDGIRNRTGQSSSARVLSWCFINKIFTVVSFDSSQFSSTHDMKEFHLHWIKINKCNGGALYIHKTICLNQGENTIWSLCIWRADLRPFQTSHQRLQLKISHTSAFSFSHCWWLRLKSSQWGWF